MPRFDANLQLMFNEWDYLDRIDAAAEAGFRAVEFLFPYEHPADRVAERLRRAGLEAVLINTPPGDLAAGERGFAARPDRRDAFADSLAQALDYAGTIGAPRIHLMTGRGESDDPNARACLVENAAAAAERGAAQSTTILLEPLNGRDQPGYFLRDFRQAETIIHEVGSADLRLQFDWYHCQIIHGDVTTAFARLLPLVGHVQIASVPSRHEPDLEELNFSFVCAAMDRLGYDGWVGAEYRPRAGTLSGLGWFEAYRAGPLPVRDEQAAS